MYADVREHDPIVGQDLPEVADNPLRADRLRLRGAVFHDVVEPLLSPAVDPVPPFSSAVRGRALVCGVEQLVEHHLRVAQESNADRIVAPDLVRVEVDVDQPRGRYRVGEAWQPAARRAVVKTRADSEYHVGVARGGVGS